MKDDPLRPGFIEGVLREALEPLRRLSDGDERRTRVVGDVVRDALRRAEREIERAEREVERSVERARRHERRPHSVPLGPRPELDVRTSFGTVRIVGVAPGEEPHVEVDGRAEVEIDRDEATNRVRINSGDGPGGKRTRLTLHVPADVRGSVQSDLGRIEAEGLVGCDLELHTDVGRIELREVHGRLQLGTDTGKIVGERVGGTIEAETEAGSIRLDVTELNAGEHRVETEAGAIRVDLAADLDVKLDVECNGGSVDLDFPSNPAAAITLALRTEVGSIRLRKLEPPARESRRWEVSASPTDGSSEWPEWTSAQGQPRSESPAPAEAPTLPETPLDRGLSADRDPAPAEGADLVPFAESAAGSEAGPTGAEPAIGPGAPRSRAGYGLAAVARTTPDAELVRVLELVAAGKLSPAEAQDILRALGVD